MFYFLFFFCVFCGEFSLLALAMVANQNNYVRPTLTEEIVLEIQNGRLELCVLFALMSFRILS